MIRAHQLREKPGRFGILVVGALLAIGCAASSLPRDDSLGSRLYYTRCRSCHAPVNPAGKTVEFWNEYLDKYAELARLNPAERDSVMAFVIRMAEHAQDPEEH